MKTSIEFNINHTKSRFPPMVVGQVFQLNQNFQWEIVLIFFGGESKLKTFTK